MVLVPHLWFSLSVDISSVGYDDLDIYILHPTTGRKQQFDMRNNGTGIYDVRFFPQEVGVFKVQIFCGGEAVPGEGGFYCTTRETIKTIHQNLPVEYKPNEAACLCLFLLPRLRCSSCFDPCVFLHLIPPVGLHTCGLFSNSTPEIIQYGTKEDLS